MKVCKIEPFFTNYLDTFMKEGKLNIWGTIFVSDFSDFGWIFSSYNIWFYHEGIFDGIEFAFDNKLFVLFSDSIDFFPYKEVCIS